MTPSDKKIASDGTPEEWWFNTKTGTVEFGRLSASVSRIGPFASKEQASQALKIISERAATIRSEDEN